MANYATLKAAIESVIRTNGNEEITGEILQNAIIALIESLGAKYQFAGIATPGSSGTNPGTPDYNVIYIAGVGTYPNFGETDVEKGHIGVFAYNGSWDYETIETGAYFEYEEYPQGAAVEFTFYDSGNPDGVSIKINKDVSNLLNEPDAAISQWWAAQMKWKMQDVQGYTDTFPSLSTNVQTLGVFGVIKNGKVIDSITGANKLIFITEDATEYVVTPSDLPYKAPADLVSVKLESGTASNVSIHVRGDMDMLISHININEIANHPAAYADAATALGDVPTLYRRKGMKVVYFDNTQQLWIEMINADDAGANWWTDVINNWIIEGPIETDMITTPTGGKQLRIGGVKKGNLDDFFNVNVWNEQTAAYATQAAAHAAVPANKRKLGAVITYLLADGWYTEQFIGTSIDYWGNSLFWKTFTDDVEYIHCIGEQKNRLIEAYFTGLDKTKIYGFENLRYLVFDNYRAVQVYLKNLTDNVIVAAAEFATNNDFIGVISVSEYQSSGVSGYVLVNIKTTDTANIPSNYLNIDKCSVLENSPMIYLHINDTINKINQNTTNIAANSLAIAKNSNDILKNSIFKSVSDTGIYDRVKNVVLIGTQADGFKIVTCRYYVSGTYKAIQFYITDSNNNPVALLEHRTDTDFEGVLHINEHNNSGIEGYAYLNIKTTDTANMTAVLNMGKVGLISNYVLPNWVPELAKSLPFAESEYLGALGNGLHTGASAFAGVTSKSVATFENQIFESDGILKSITLFPKGTTMAIGIGIVDQRNIGVIRKEFEIDTTANVLQTVNVEKMGIKVYEGETLFAIFSDSDHSIGFTTNSSTTADLQMIYAADGDVLARLATEYGGRLNLYWEYEEIKSPFAYKEDIVSVSEKADAANELASEALSNFGLVKDRQGNYYQLVVVNGALSIIPLVYKKVLVICNSIGINGRVYAQGWCGIRGMASSKNGLDYKTHLENGLKQKDSNAVVVLRNVWNWEQDFDSITPADLMNGYLDSDVDCIIFRAGENVPSGRIADFQENLTDLLNYCISQCPNANLFITSMVWANEGKDTALQNTALSMGVPLIDVSSSDAIYRERIGDYLEGDYTPDGGTTWDTTQQVLYKVLTSGIASHTNDVGMLRIANNILTALKYEQLELLHNITIGEIGNYTCSIINNKWVEGGIVNVFSNGNTVTVTDANNNNVVVTNHNDGVFTFEMPNTDVTITVS